MRWNAAGPAHDDNNTLRDVLRTSVLRGLNRSPKTLPCKLFYDDRGSELFEQICELPEYYLTRTELAIMREHVHEMSELLGPRVAIIEYGSGSSTKSRLLLQALRNPVAYVPIDISASALQESAARLRQQFPELAVLPICADYMQPVVLPHQVRKARRRIIYFPGSTIGNFHPRAASGFLHRAAKLCGRRGGLLIGVDQRKDSAILEAAYNDSRGVTAAFNLNALAHVNRTLKADFDLQGFDHRAFWNEQASRIEMHLISRCRQIVAIDGCRVRIEAGEHIVTEYSYKYDLASFERLARRSNFKVRATWTDARQWFCVHYAIPRVKNDPRAGLPPSR